MDYVEWNVSLLEQVLKNGCSEESLKQEIAYLKHTLKNARESMIESIEADYMITNGINELKERLDNGTNE